ncbi:MAG: major capsid protein [Alloacidobacterium sp.]
MATGSWPTLVDVASRTDAEGNIPVVAEMLSQSNEMYEDFPWVKANERTGHLFVFRTSIPTGSWRSYNMGVPASKSTTAKSRVGIGMLEDYSQVDRALAEHTGDKERFRQSEDVAFLEGMSQTIAQTLVYGNTTINPSEFMGLASFYNTININNAQNAANVLNGGGTGSSNTSLWLLGLSPETIFMVFPEGSHAGLDMEDKGDVVPAYDSLGNRFEAYTGWFRQQVGLCPKDWRYGARVANIDVTNAGLAGPNALDIFATMAEMQFLFPKLSKNTSGIVKTDAPMDDVGVRPVFYANRTLLHFMQIQAMRDRNVLLRLEDYAGRVTDNWRGIPIKCVDQILNTESTVN